MGELRHLLGEQSEHTGQCIEFIVDLGVETMLHCTKVRVVLVHPGLEVWEMIASQVIVIVNRSGVKKVSSGNTDYIFIVSFYHDPLLSTHRVYSYLDLPSSTTATGVNHHPTGLESATDEKL